MSLTPTTPFVKTKLATLDPGIPLQDLRLTVRSLENVTITTGNFAQTICAVAADEWRPLCDVSIAVTSFGVDVTLSIDSSNHRVGDLITFDYTPTDIPAGRTLFIKDLKDGSTLVSLTSASSGYLQLSLGTNNTWAINDTVDLANFNSLSLLGTAGAGFIDLPAQSSDPATPATSHIRVYSNSLNKFAWIGASGNVRNFDGTLTASRTYMLPDADTNFPVFGQTITFTGPTAARSIALPNANFTVARTDAANTFTGDQTFSGNVVGSLGAAGTPSLTFVGRTTDGLFSAAANKVGVATNGIERVRFTEDGNVLIATSTNGSGRLQFPTGTTNADGITLGNVNIFQNASNQLTINATTVLQTGTTQVLNGAAGATNTLARLIKSVTAIANNTATDVLTVTIPNAAHSASLRVRLVGSLGAGGAIGANEATGSIGYDYSIARTAGVATVTTASTAFGSATSAVAGAATITITSAATAMTGTVSATQTFTVQVTIARGSGSSTNHTCQVVAEIINANASGVTIA